MSRVKSAISSFELTPFALVLIAVTFVALGLRLWGIRFGLPFEYHVDEVQYVRQAASMGQNGPQPVWWNNPPFFKYILFAEYGGLFAIGRLLGHYASAADFGVKNSLDPTNLYLLGRATSALFGTLTVPLVYFIGKQAWSKLAGIIGAGFLSIAFIHVRDSHYAVNDVAFTFFATLSILASVMIVKSGSAKWYVLAGLSLGLGFATKYSAVFCVIPVFIAHVLSPGVGIGSVRTWQLHRFLLTPVVGVLAAILASPYFVIAPLDVVRDAYEALYLAGQHGFDGWQIDPDGGYAFYLKTLVWGLGWGLALLSLAGVMAAALRHRRIDIVLISFPVLYFLIAGRQESYYFARFVIPIVPTLLSLGAIVLVWLSELVFREPARQTGFVSVTALLLALSPVASSIWHNQLLSGADTRTVAKDWIERELPESATIALDWPFYGPPLATIEQQVPHSAKTFEIIVANGHGLSDRPLSWYVNQGVDYVVTSSYIAELDVLDSNKQESREEFYRSLSEGAILISEFRPEKEGLVMPFIFDELYGPSVTLEERTMTGPVLQVYALGKAAAQAIRMEDN